VRSYLRLANARELLLSAALLVTTIVTAGCGSPSPQTEQKVLPPPIPAAEPVLLFNGTGTSSDVTALEAVLANLGVGYVTADSAKLNALSEQELAGYKLIIVPGGNSVAIGQGVTTSAVANLRGAVQQYGVNYLGVCAGAFFGAYSIHNGANLTDGVSFNFYADELKGIHHESVEISFPAAKPLNVYWQDGPQLSGWGQVVAKFPDGTPAIVEGQSGKGFVVFTGVHPEAPAGWLDSSMGNIQVAVDQAYAGTIIEAALDGTPLPHF